MSNYIDKSFIIKKIILIFYLISYINITHSYKYKTNQLSSFHTIHKIINNRHNIQQCFASINDDPDLQSIRGMKGFYTRPSKAIEKGGGFFIPGLENGKIRIVSAIFLFFLYVINQYGVNQISTTEKISTSIGIICTLFLLFQGVAELFDTANTAIITNTAIGLQSNEFLSVIQRSQTSTKSLDIIDSVARSIIKTCANTNYIVVFNNSNNIDSSSSNIIYEIGPVSNIPTKPFKINNNNSNDRSISIATNTVNEFQQRYSLLSQAISPSLPIGTTTITIVTKDYPTSTTTWLIAQSIITNNNTPLLALNKNQEWIELLITSTLVK